MACNVGGIDRTIRIVAGLAFLAAALFAPVEGWMQIVLFVLAAIALVTAAVRYCPLNSLIGLNTCATSARISRRV